MRSPPPVLPPSDNGEPRYQPTWMERAGPDAPLKLRIALFAIVVGFVAIPVCIRAIGKLGLHGAPAVALILLAPPGSAFLAYSFGMRFLTSVGSAVGAFTLPTGNSTPYEHQFSLQESLVAKGDMAAALESYETIIAEQPGAIAPRLRAAEHYARSNRNPLRASELFKEIRDTVGVPARDAVYASSRLVDLYEGPLEDPGRALVELRRIIEQYPGSSVAKAARGALPAMKARLHAPAEDR
ncbi:MAG: hypothetical protein ABJE47_02750 [bacterium]